MSMPYSSTIIQNAANSALQGRARQSMLAIVLAAIATFCWPLQEYTGGILVRNHSMVQVVALRYIAHLLLLCLWIPVLKGKAAFSSDRKLLQLLRGMCMFGMPAGYIMSREYISNSWAWSVFWMVIAGAIALAAIGLREPGIRAGWVPMLLLAASAWLFLAPTPQSPLGSMFAAVMGLSFAGYLILSRILKHESLPASLLYTALGALAPMAVPAMLVWTPVQPNDLIPALLTGALSILILGAFDVALSFGSLWTVGGMLSLVMITELLVQNLAYGTPIFARDVAGAAIALIAVGCCIATAIVSSRTTAESGQIAVIGESLRRDR